MQSNVTKQMTVWAHTTDRQQQWNKCAKHSPECMHSVNTHLYHSILWFNIW